MFFFSVSSAGLGLQQQQTKLCNNISPPSLAYNARSASNTFFPASAAISPAEGRTKSPLSSSAAAAAFAFRERFFCFFSVFFFSSSSAPSSFDVDFLGLSTTEHSRRFMASSDSHRIMTGLRIWILLTFEEARGGAAAKASAPLLPPPPSIIAAAAAAVVAADSSVALSEEGKSQREHPPAKSAAGVVLSGSNRGSW